jgi:hypothetical protein
MLTSVHVSVVFAGPLRRRPDVESDDDVAILSEFGVSKCFRAFAAN